MPFTVIKEAQPQRQKTLLYGLPGCISGDAEIRVRTNYDKFEGATRTIKLENLHKRFNGLIYQGDHGGHENEKLEARAINEDTGEFEWTSILGVVYSGEQKTYRLATTKHSIEATSDHRVWTKDGWKEVKDITAQDEVGILAPTHSVRGKEHARHKEIMVKYHPTAPHKKVGKHIYCRMPEYRYIYEANLNGMTLEEYISLLNNYDGRKIKTIPAGMEVHHINGNHNDNAIENLATLTKSEHAKLGAEQSRANLKETQSVVFERVVSVEESGTQPVYDIQCEAPYHSFVANGIVVHNCGKSTLASQFSRPLFIDVEGGLTNMTVDRTPTIKRYLQAVQCINMIHKEVEEHKKDYDTIVIDSIDWLVRRAEEHAAGIATLDDKGVEHRDMSATIGKANGGYGNGNKQLENHLRSELMPALQLLVDDGFGICLIAHADQKDVMDAEGFTVTKITPAIGERFMEAWVQWCDNVFYLKNEGGERKLLLEGTDTILAKNRLGKTGQISLSETSIQDILKPKGEKEDK